MNYKCQSWFWLQPDLIFIYGIKAKYHFIFNAKDSPPIGYILPESCHLLETYIDFRYIRTTLNINWYASVFAVRADHRSIANLPNLYVQRMISCINDTIYVGHEDPQMWEIILFAIAAAFTFVAFLLYIVIYMLRLKETKIVRIMSRLSPKYERDILLNAAVDVGICSIAVDYADFDYIWGMTFQSGNRHLGPHSNNKSIIPSRYCYD